MSIDRSKRPRVRVVQTLLWTTGLVLACAIVVIVALIIDWRRVAPYLVTRTTGREFSIDGPAELHVLTWHPRLSVEDVRFGNAPWSKQKDMVDVGRFRIGLALRRLLHGNLVFPRLRLENAIVR